MRSNLIKSATDKGTELGSIDAVSIARSKELELMDMISIFKAEPERLDNMMEGSKLLAARNKMLEDQVELFEGERKQLVEAAFSSAKECRVLNKSLIDKDRQIDSLSTMLSERKDIVEQFTKLKRKSLWFEWALLLSLIANLAFTLYYVQVF